MTDDLALRDAVWGLYRDWMERTTDGCSSDTEMILYDLRVALDADDARVVRVNGGDAADACAAGYKAAHGDVERDEEGLGFRVTPNPYRALRGDDE